MIRHQIGAIRASGALANRIIELLDSVERDLRRKINGRLKGIEERGVDLGPETTQRLLDLERDLREILGQPHREIKPEVRQFLLDLARGEPVFVKELLEDALPVVVRSACRRRPSYARSSRRSRSRARSCVGGWWTSRPTIAAA